MCAVGSIAISTYHESTAEQYFHS